MSLTPKAIVLHHNDNDGYASGAILKDYLKKLYFPGEEVYDPMAIEDIDCNYEVSLMGYLYDNKIRTDLLEKIFITDLSLSIEEDFQFIINNTDRVVYIDHHKTSIEMITHSHLPITIPGFRVLGISATGAALIYLFAETHDDEKGEEAKEFIRIYNDSLIIPPKDEVDHILDDVVGVNKVFRLINDYDIFNAYDDCINFRYGYQANHIDDLMSYIDCPEGVIKQFTDRECAKGKAIREYLDKENENDCDRYGATRYIEFRDSSGEHKLYRCFMLNTTRFSSLTFGNKLKEGYDICVAFEYKYASNSVAKSMYKYSLYSDKDYVDCASIAKAYGGGGHKGAAGFYSDTMIL